MPTELMIRPMTRAEFGTLVDWAAAEGWNPGLDDARVFWDTDPQGFIAAELDGELIGGGSIVAYGERFGFMGFFIMRQDHRGHGLGRRLWLARRDRLIARLRAPAVIGMDGVFSMQGFYARGGFVPAHRDLRFEGRGAASPPGPTLVDLAAVSFDDVLCYDTAHFPTERRTFLAAWVTQPGARALGSVGDGRLRGYGVIRPCRQGYKIGPLFADDAATAEALFLGLGDLAPGQPIYLDVPEHNPAAMALARRHGLREVFGCARMYHGPAPVLPEHEVYGITSFELG